MKFVPFSENFASLWPQWMNEFRIIEFYVFPAKDDHLCVLGSCHGNFNIKGVQNSSQFMLLLGFGVHVYLLWTGLIFISVNDTKFVSFWVF